MDRELLEKSLAPALDFIKSTGRELYCGEFGAIALADRDSRRRWHTDIIDLFLQHRIGRACWSYKEMDFALVDRNNKIVDEELISIISRKR